MGLSSLQQGNHTVGSGTDWLVFAFTRDGSSHSQIQEGQKQEIPFVGELPTPFRGPVGSLWARMLSTLLTLQPIPQPGTAWKSVQYPRVSVPSSCGGRRAGQRLE